MNREQIIQMARDCKMPYDFVTNEIVGIEKLELFAALVAAAERDKWMDRIAILIRGEREACAKVCEGRQQEGLRLEGCAAAIRARGETK